jgi:HPt (histidine-containing phosphotransfer) domain-containing protein
LATPGELTQAHLKRLPHQADFAENGQWLAGGEQAMRKLVVRIDRDLSDLIPGFMARKRQDVDVIRTAADASNHVALGELGHKIKGEGGSYGFDGISKIGTKLELAAKAQDPIEARRQADRLLEYLDSVEIIYE